MMTTHKSSINSNLIFQEITINLFLIFCINTWKLNTKFLGCDVSNEWNEPSNLIHWLLKNEWVVDKELFFIKNHQVNVVMFVLILNFFSYEIIIFQKCLFWEISVKIFFGYTRRITGRFLWQCSIIIYNIFRMHRIRKVKTKIHQLIRPVPYQAK